MANDRTRGAMLLQAQLWQPTEYPCRAVCADARPACAAMPSEPIGGGRFAEGPALEEAPRFNVIKHFQLNSRHLPRRCADGAGELRAYAHSDDRA